MKRRGILIVVAAALTVAALAVTFFVTHERREVEVYEPPRGEARNNPYLAVTRLWSRFGDEPYVLRTLDFAPQSALVDPTIGYHVVLLARPDFDPEEKRAEEWVRFVEHGGRLVLVAPHDGARPPLLRKFGFEKGDEGQVAGDIVSFDVDLGLRPASEALVAWQRTTDQLWRTSSGNALALRRSRGQGEIVLLASAEFLTNRRVGAREHATAAVALMDPNVDEDILVIRHPRPISWWRYALERFWPALVPLVLLLLLALQSGRVRFGPILADPPHGRRRRLEHVEATGRFLWKNGEVGRLAAAARGALFDALRQRRLLRSDEEPTTEELSRALDVNPAKARRVLTDPRPHQTSRFRQWMQKIEGYRRKL